MGQEGMGGKFSNLSLQDRKGHKFSNKNEGKGYQEGTQVLLWKTLNKNGIFEGTQGKP